MTTREILKKLRKDNGGTQYKSVNGKIYKRDKWWAERWLNRGHWYFVTYISQCYENVDGKVCANGAEVY